MAGGMGDKLDRWERAISSAVEREQFGQVVEATETYQQLVNWIAQELKVKPSTLSADERTFVIKVQKCVYNRLQKLKAGGAGPGGVQTDDLRRLAASFRRVFNGQAPFPIDTSGLKDAVTEEEPEEEPTPFAAENQGSLRPCPRLRQGEKALQLFIDNIGLKDAQTYLDPFIRVHVKDVSGGDLELSQSTPHPTQPRKDHSVIFGVTVFLQTPMARLPADTAIFFEFCHYKPKKDKVSVRCWSMLTMEEIKEGPLALEIYAKPTDFHRRKFHKHSVKELYFHIGVSFIKG
eukprot:TRINITY_DN4647_c0_g1_i1.p1 TRINITY_DN4647_c0_g1~~TRINITY_DN4647_c0_g1_i1.p1  ORF type:complete len:290 (+),score=45.35 TRINITY_DN4647_c0_g1_i1:57-926(+)